ncbi:hypothetical protein C8R43DRAFT_1140159 [Mycena crocata]|nr:hypothetical protein C8R43DRAFT_1140159 [Mycena crocata]
MSSYHHYTYGTHARGIYFLNYFHILGVSFLIWDHIITLDTEYRFLWTRAKSTSAYWFFALRYGALMTNIPVVVFSFVALPNSFVSSLFIILAILTIFAVSVVMILRIYALYGRSARVLWWLVGIATGFTGITLWSVHQGQHGFPLTILSGCHLSIPKSASYYLAVSWECLFAFDSIIFGLTIFNAWVTRRHVGPHANMPIHRLLVRDGAMYFGAMALANLANIVTFLIGGPLLAGSLATFATCVSVTMMSRLMLNLHERTDYGVLTALHLSGVEEELVAHSANDENQTVASPTEIRMIVDSIPMLPLAHERSRHGLRRASESSV